jgi:YbgC/YbaW family acyl-CoA thioester hydrolase
MNLYFRLIRVLITARQRPTGSIWDTRRTSFHVNVTDLDAQGHMNNGRYLTILDLGRIDLLVRAGVWHRLRARRWFPVVTAQSITYRRPLRLGQRFTVTSRILGFDAKHSYVEHRIQVGATVHAHAVVQARFLSAGGSIPQADLLVELGTTKDDAPTPPEWVLQWAALARQQHNDNDAAHEAR